MDIQKRFQVTVQGQGRHTVVLGNGFGTTQSAWKNVIHVLQEHYRVVSFETAGAVPSTIDAYQPLRHARLHGFAEDLVGIVESLELHGATYVGHSLGGMMGLLAVCAEPDLFSGLVLLGASARYIDDPDTGYVGGFSEAEVTAIHDGMASDYATWANGFSRLAMKNPGQPELADSFASSLKALRPDLATAILTTAFRSDCRAEALQYGRLGLPTLLLQTAHDVAVPLSAAEWLAQATGAELHQLAIEGHFPHIVAPEVVGQQILDFVEQHAA